MLCWKLSHITSFKNYKLPRKLQLCPFKITVWCSNDWLSWVHLDWKARCRGTSGIEHMMDIPIFMIHVWSKMCRKHLNWRYASPTEVARDVVREGGWYWMSRRAPSIKYQISIIPRMTSKELQNTLIPAFQKGNFR